MIIPTTTVLLLLLGPAVLGALGVVYPPVRPWVLVVDALWLALVLIDALTLPRRRRLTVRREGDHNLSVGKRNRFALTVENRSWRALRLRVTESFPDCMQVEGLPARAAVGRGQRLRLAYAVVPRRRGAFGVGRTYVRARSLLGLWQRQLVLSLEHPLRVFPDVKLLNTYALLARRNRIDLLGFRTARGRGSDVEFDRLREYQPDDDHRRIDPFASARYQRLIAREYQVSRNQNVFFMIDCGRVMAAESAQLSNLDHALNAALMLGSLALESGDRVGLMAFDREVRALLPVRGGGPRRKNELLYALYDLHVAAEESDLERAFDTVHRRVRQRSLVVLLTNVMDEASFALLVPQLRVLTRRHLPLVVLLRDEDLFSLAESTPRSVAEMFEVGAAAELAAWREGLAERLQRLGVLVLDLAPSQATPELINSYLRIKAEQLL